MCTGRNKILLKKIVERHINWKAKISTSLENNDELSLNKRCCGDFFFAALFEAAVSIMVDIQLSFEGLDGHFDFNMIIGYVL